LELSAKWRNFRRWSLFSVITFEKYGVAVLCVLEKYLGE
jgi:hypothetical protein